MGCIMQAIDPVKHYTFEIFTKSHSARLRIEQQNDQMFKLNFKATLIPRENVATGFVSQALALIPSIPVFGSKSN